MNLKELSSPIRMYWDLGPEPASRLDHARIAGEIAAAKVLTLQLTESGPTLSTPCLTVLETLKDKPLALSLVLPIACRDDGMFEQLRRFPIRLLLFSTSDPASLRTIVEIKKQVQGKPPVGAAFSVTRSNFRMLPDVLEFCIGQRVETLVLPMLRLAGREEVFSFSAEERRELTTELSRTERPGWLKIIIHDPFLWRAFFPAVDFPDGGCQAANTMLYISSEGEVYPCPTLPIKIGDLRETSLEEVIKSELKKKTRQQILSSPSGCNGCPELNQCKGGCRGRAYVLHKNFQKNDPICNGAE